MRTQIALINIIQGQGRGLIQDQGAVGDRVAGLEAEGLCLLCCQRMKSLRIQVLLALKQIVFMRGYWLLVKDLKE